MTDLGECELGELSRVGFLDSGGCELGESRCSFRMD